MNISVKVGGLCFAAKFTRLICVEMLSPKGSQRAGKIQQEAGKKPANANVLGEFKRSFVPNRNIIVQRATNSNSFQATSALADERKIIQENFGFGGTENNTFMIAV